MNKRCQITGRFIKNPNRWVVDGDIAYCFSDSTLLFFTDFALLEELKKYNFGKIAQGYSATWINGENISVHRLITKAKSGDVIDHINRNKMDNRVCNLRVTDKSGNAFNSKRRTTNTSGRTGVWYRKDTKSWCAEIKVNCKKISLGCFKTFEEAVSTREKAEEKYYGYKLSQ